MDLQLAYNQIDEYFSKYIESGNETDKSKMLKVICDVINSDYKYKGALANGDFDYLPVLIATNDAIKHFNSDKEESSFHKYLFVCIHNAVNKDIEISKGKDNANLNYNNIKLLKKIKKLMPIYQDNKQKVAEALEISIDKIDELLYSQIESLDKEIESDESKSTLSNFITSVGPTPEEAFESKEKLQDLFNQFDSAWKELKPIHQGVVSDWLTALILSKINFSNNIEAIGYKEDSVEFLNTCMFVNKTLVSLYFEDANYSLPVTFETIAQLHGITKSAVCKKIDIFTDGLLLYPDIVKWLKQAIKYSEKKNNKNVEKIKILET